MIITQHKCEIVGLLSECKYSLAQEFEDTFMNRQLQGIHYEYTWSENIESKIILNIKNVL